jgi:hypothetical protein
LDAPDAAGPTGAPDVARPDVADGEKGIRATSEFFYPAAALRLLGVRRRASGSADSAGGLVQRIEVALGDYRIEVLLAEAPAGDRTGRSEKIHTWIASAPYLVWTPLPHDFPADGVAFAGVWRRRGGCLFLDLAAVPGAITIGGDQAAATWARSPSRTSCAWARPLTTSAWSSWEARWAAASAGCRVAARRRGPGAAPATPGREGGDGLLPVRLG